MQQDVRAGEVLGGEEVSTGGTAGFSTGYRTYVLLLVTLVYVVNYLDRQILGILNPQIQAEFHVSSFQIGLLNGPVFAAMYATLGIPIAILADRLNRRNVIAASLAIFSVMTFISAYTGKFWQLMLTRFGTGIGEAGTGPSINSVLADLYPPKQRASALAFYSAGLNIGLLLSFFGGAWIDAHYGWRMAFLVAGTPGLALTLLLLTTMQEPPRGHVEQLADTERAPSTWAVAGYLWRQKSFCWMAFGTAMNSFGGYAGIAFFPKFLETTHHLTIQQVGLVLALLTGIGGAFGTYFAGVCADFFAKRDVRWNMYVPIIVILVVTPIAPFAYLSPSTKVALIALIAPAMVGASFVGPAYAMAQALVPLRMRARSAAILLFILNIIGLGLAAPVVGGISDLLAPYVGTDSIRYALMTGILTGLIAAFCYWQASKTLKSDIARVTEA
jgi:predicted MFS family arabinose efflux permease